MNDEIRRIDLREQLVDRRYERSGTERRRGAERDDVRPPALLLQLGCRGSHGRIAIRARGHVANLRSRELVEEGVS